MHQKRIYTCIVQIRVIILYLFLSALRENLLH